MKFRQNSRSLVVFSHLNHELAIFGLVQRLRPNLIYLTDGGGKDRIGQTKAGLEQIGLSVKEMKGLNVGTSNFVTKLDVAFEAYSSVIPKGLGIGEDFELFCAVRSRPNVRIEVSKAIPIGRYDGLRALSILRWKLGIPPLNILPAWWYAPLRRLLRRCGTLDS